MERKLRFLVFFGLALAATADFITNCPKECKCVWARGNKQANCSHANIQQIPRTLSTELQNLDLTGNNFSVLPRHTFDAVGLVNLKKLILRDCKLLTIEKDALKGLAIVVELDLSKNQLKILRPDIFKETVNIRSIMLNDNLLDKLDDGLFNNLPVLQRLDLSNNKIKQLGMKTFLNVPNLNILRLNSNKLESISAVALSSLDLLNFDFYDNPWRCDCNLLDFRNWVISKNFMSLALVKCAVPERLQGKLLKELDSSDLACLPNNTFQSFGTDINISCQVSGNPSPQVNWAIKPEIVDKTYRYEGEVKYFITHSRVENKRLMNITIIHAETLLTNNDNP